MVAIRSLLLLLIVLLFAGTHAASQCAGSSFKNFIDMSQWVSEDTPNWPTNTNYSLTIMHFDTGDGLRRGQTEKLVMSTHTGTHIDAPRHMGGNQTVEQIPRENLYGPGVIINVENKTKSDPDYEMTREDILDFEAVHGRIPPRAVVLFNTGWGRKWCSVENYLGTEAKNVSALVYPALSYDIARFLIEERDIVGVGLDSVSLDTANDTHFQAHVELLRHGKWGLEAVANMDKLPPTGFFIYVFPMMIRAAAGAPARVIAFVDELTPH